jgi:YesN/AraC family two-component response regulator
MYDEDAYTMFLEDEHDLVITDLYLPNMNGFGLLQKIKETKPQTTVFLISAHNTPDNMKAAKELGAARFFPKPLNLDTLEAAVREALTYQQ